MKEFYLVFDEVFKIRVPVADGVIENIEQALAWLSNRPTIKIGGVTFALLDGGTAVNLSSVVTVTLL